ncbi:hypothetical protein ACFLTR_02920, partial [Chloroflexota bacterium]
MSEAGWIFSKSAMTDMASDTPARKYAPIRKPPVMSFMTPTINGPANPPISPTQKNIPPADPMYLEPTSGISINMSIRRGQAKQKDVPYKTNPAMRAGPDVVAIINTAIAVTRVVKATMRPLKR